MEHQLGACAAKILFCLSAPHLDEVLPASSEKIAEIHISLRAPWRVGVQMTSEIAFPDRMELTVIGLLCRTEAWRIACEAIPPGGRPRISEFDSKGLISLLRKTSFALQQAELAPRKQA